VRGWWLVRLILYYFVGRRGSGGLLVDGVLRVEMKAEESEIGTNSLLNGLLTFAVSKLRKRTTRPTFAFCLSYLLSASSW